MGKVMLGKMPGLADVTWSRLIDAVPEETLVEWLADSRLLAFVDWTMLPHMSEILREIGSRLPGTGKRPFLFIDLADPTKRSKQDIRDVLELLRALQEVADIVLGMNKNESSLVGQVLGVASTHDLHFRAASIREKLVIFLRDHHADMIILDMVMPGMDGVETLKAIQEFKPEQKVVILSAYAEEEQIQAVKSLGVYAYMQKPVDLKEMVSTIRNTLAGIRSEDL
jgi:CheY-like chemotaxis protein